MSLFEKVKKSAEFLNQFNYGYEYGGPVDSYLSNITDFQRAYLFKVIFQFPKLITQSLDYNQAAVLVKTTNLPDTMVEETSTFFMGQQYKLSSVRRFTDWNVTLYIDNDTEILKMFYEWNRLCQDNENIYKTPKEYMVDQFINLLDSNSPSMPKLTYKLVKAWPKSINNITLDYMTNDFTTMDVMFSYQYHTVTDKQGVIYSYEISERNGKYNLGADAPE
jgi:hypothetical protein